MKRIRKKHKFDPVLISVLADAFINFSVFWLSVAMVTPAFPGIDPLYKPAAVTVDLLVGIIVLYVGYILRRKIK